jgi:glycosyltransferase involved in cell wall biosynthesis
LKYLFLHPVFPGQFLRVMQALGERPGNDVVHLSVKANMTSLPGVRRFTYKEPSPLPANLPRYLQKLHTSVNAGTEVVKALGALQKKGFVPDLSVAYGGWGQGMFLKDLYPTKPVLGYFEWYANGRGFEYGFDPEHALTLENAMALRMHNSELLLDLASFDRGVTATEFQRSSFPQELRGKLTALHDGVDAEYFSPAPEKLKLPRVKLDLSGAKEIVTYLSRGLEPARGFHRFIPAAQLILKRRPNAHIVIVGESEQVFYSRKPPKGKTYKDLMLEKTPLDPARVHFTGWLQREEYRSVLRASSAHVYLTVPYVLSWSLLEAMSLGCLVVGSRTPPVEEMIRHGENGLLADWFSPESIAGEVCRGLDNPGEMQKLRQRARETVLERYDLAKVLPKQLALIDGLTSASV